LIWEPIPFLIFYPYKLNATGFSNLINETKNNKSKDSLSKYIDYYTLGTKIESKNTVSKENLNNYLKADSLKAMK
jgi:ribosomal protein S8